MAAPGKTGSEYKHSDQERDNKSHDDTYGLNAVIPVGEYSGAVYRLQVDSSGNLKTTATVSGGGDASASNQTSGAQKTQIVDSGGEAVTVTSNKLDVNASIDTTGLATTTTDTNTTAISTNLGAKADASATTDTGTFSLISLFKRLLEKVTTLVAKDFSTSAKQDTIIGHIDGIEGSVDQIEGYLDGVEGLLTTIDTDTGTIATEVAGLLTDTELRATPVPVSGTVTATPTGTQNVDVTANTIGLATSAKQDTLLTELQLKADLTETQPVSLASVPTHAVTQSGTWTEANSAAIKTAVETIDNAISGSEMQVDVVGALPAGTNAIGKLSANSGVDIGDVDVTSSVSSTLDHGSNLDIDTTAEQITTTSFAAKFGVTVKSAATNTGTLYIGDSSSVTAGTTGSTDGFPLEPGESITLPVNNPNLLYAIASVANQKVFWSAV